MQFIVAHKYSLLDLLLWLGFSLYLSSLPCSYPSNVGGYGGEVEVDGNHG